MWTGTDDKIEILWIRHGMTAANKEHRYLGTTDEPLATEGFADFYIFQITHFKLRGTPKIPVIFSHIVSIHQRYSQVPRVYYEPQA